MIPLPFLLRRLAEIGVIDEALEAALVRDGIITLPDLELALAEGRPSSDHDGLRQAAAVIAAGQRELTLGRAFHVLEPVLDAIAQGCPELTALEASGAVRRTEPLVRSLSIVACAAVPERAVDAIAPLPAVGEVLYRTGRRLLVLVQGYEVDIRIASPDEHGAVLFATTGPSAHVADVLKRRGLRLGASEAEVYTHAGLAYLPPQLRHAPEAIEAAEARRVPRLVQRADIRGDLHMHTTFSDGRDSLSQMVRAAHALGYEYIAITDHSEHAGASRTITLAELSRQRDEIEALRDSLPGLTILQGLEVDILPSGRLDCPDEVMERLDIVLASLHDSAGHPPAKLTERCLGAIRHPLVSAVTHPGNQLVGRREAYDMDYDAVYAAAAETGTLLEIDGAPSHLDLDGDRARAAAAAGVTLVIDSDCHKARLLEQQMDMGVGTARRGWIEPHQVLNTRPLGEVLTFLARKRRG